MHFMSTSICINFLSWFYFLTSMDYIILTQKHGLGQVIYFFSSALTITCRWCYWTISITWRYVQSTNNKLTVYYVLLIIAEVMLSGSDSSPSLIGQPLTTCTTVGDDDAIVRCPCGCDEVYCTLWFHWFALILFLFVFSSLHPSILFLSPPPPFFVFPFQDEGLMILCDSCITL